MATVLPPNADYYRQMVEIGEHGSREFFERLKAFSVEHDLLEADFSMRVSPQFHEVFWELYLAATLGEIGAKLERGKASLSEPDFRFRHGDSTVYVEAVACGDPKSDSNAVPPPNDSDDDFESGLAPEGRNMQRLAQAIDAKIAAVTRPAALEVTVSRGKHLVVIALNGCRALNGHPHNDPGVPLTPLVARTLFGATEQRINASGVKFWLCADRAVKDPNSSDSSFPVGHFTRPTWEVKDAKTGTKREAPLGSIAGVLYSQVCASHTAPPLGYDLVFVQNPYGPDATGLFSFCKGGVWVQENAMIGRKSFPASPTPSALVG